ncbi:hypothetical protein [Hymenobacter terrenus]|uniref:hypothetical protein n=1 Tax=Hymenobacter terrenus TaxID=1629124 RepID=UPI00061A07FC|nr:hypothetical protein [Hymenobacter terrenus]
MDLLLNGCYDLLERGYPELQPLFDKYAPPMSAEEDAEAERQTAEAMKQLFATRHQKPTKEASAKGSSRGK